MRLRSWEYKEGNGNLLDRQTLNETENVESTLSRTILEVKNTEGKDLNVPYK